LGTAHILRKVLIEKYIRANAGASDMGTINSSDRIAAILYSLGTWFVSGIYVLIPCIKEVVDLPIIIIIIIIIIINSHRCLGLNQSSSNKYNWKGKNKTFININIHCHLIRSKICIKCGSHF
jgi:hypothetical protein